MILESVENTPLIFPTIEENGVTITKKYAELSTAKKIQADCDMKATNIILQGLPADIYSLQERECKVYDAFDKFTHIKRESLHKYYLRFTQLINDMNIYNMKLGVREWVKLIPSSKQSSLNDFYTTDDWAPLVDSSFAVPDFSLGDDLIACLNKAIAFLIVVTSSRGDNENYSGTGYKRKLLVSGEKKMSSRQAKVCKCYNCQGEGHMARQYEEQLVFLAHPGVLDGQAVQTFILNNAAFQTEDLDTYDSDYDDISNAKAVLMANSSNYGSDVISEVPHSETYLNDMENQSVHAQQDSNWQAQQDSMILSMIEQISKQMINHVNNWEKANKEQNNKSVTSELERYKE
ncbi:hypothetical protein Tco_0757742 [Tanacetum coccineum]